MRISKEHDERRNEILDIAERLFQQKGYQKCTINDILREVGIAKGTFYYYFTSKDEVMEAIVERYTELIRSRALAAVEKEASPEEKILAVFMSMNIMEDVTPGMFEEIHRPENILLHQKTLCQSILVLTPILASVIEEGNQKNLWHCTYPEAYMRIFLTCALTLTDDEMFEQEGQQEQIMGPLLSVLDKMLEKPEGFCMSVIQRKESEQS